MKKILKKALRGDLLALLSLRRPYGGRAESALVYGIADEYGGEVIRTRSADLGAFVDLGGRTLFTAHLDTVHGSDGQQVVMVSNDIAYKADGQPLGADDGAGVWLLLDMIRRGVPGGYWFPVGEERGGVGSRGLVDYHPDLLAQYDRAVAFDRRGVDSIITHQAGGRCCSDAFADALADALNAVIPEGFYSADPSGVYTDTAEFTGLIPECTNISVGYYSEHTGRETLDIAHLDALAVACRAVDWDALPVVRSVADDGLLGEEAWFSDYLRLCC